MKLHRLGGYAAIASTCAYIVYAALGRRLQPAGNWSDAAKTMASMLAAPDEFYVHNLLLIVCYILMLMMVLALHERMQADAPYLTRLMLIAMSAGTAIGITEAIVNLKSIGIIVPTRDISAFRACWSITLGLHFMVGHATAWTWLFIGCGILRTHAFSRVLGWLCLISGILWIPNFFFIQIGFVLITPIYLLLGGVSLVWIGIALLRTKTNPIGVQ
jgi:hypothetical protein